MVRLILLCIIFFFTAYACKSSKNPALTNPCKAFEKAIKKGWKYDEKKHIYIILPEYETTFKSGLNCLIQKDSSYIKKLLGIPNSQNVERYNQYYLTENCYEKGKKLNGAKSLVVVYNKQGISIRVHFSEIEAQE